MLGTMLTVTAYFVVLDMAWDATPVVRLASTAGFWRGRVSPAIDR